MTSFVDVTTGANTLASDINQYADKLNGTTSAGVIVSGGASAFVPFTGKLSTAPGSTSAIYAALVSGDTTNRMDVTIRSDGYGMLRVGNGGASVSGNWYGNSAGWKTDQSVTVGGALTVVGSSSFAGINATGTASLDNGNLTTDGSGNVTGVSFSGKIKTIRNGTGQVNNVFTGATTPSSPSTGDIWIQA